MAIKRLLGDSSVPVKYTAVHLANTNIYSTYPSLALQPGLWNVSYPIDSFGSSSSTAYLYGNPRVLINGAQYGTGIDNVFPSGVQSIGYDFDGVTWATRVVYSTTVAATLTSYSSLYAYGKFIVSDNIGVHTSTDGSTWTLASNLTPRGLTLSSNGRIFGAVGGGNQYAVYSDDGITWTSASYTGSNSTNSYITANGSTVVAVGDTAGTVYKSINNGVTWATGVTLNHLFASAAYGAGQYVLLGTNGGRLSVSTDATTWTQVGFYGPASASASNQNTIYNIQYIGTGQYLQTGNQSGSYINLSTDGIHWNNIATQPAATGSAATAAVFGLGNYIYAGTGTSSWVQYSTSGATWTNPFVQSNPAVLGQIVYNAGVYTVTDGSSSNTLYQFSNQLGLSVGSVAVGSTSNIASIAYGNGLYVAVGANGKVSTSTDTVTWTTRTSPLVSTDDFQVVTYTNNLWIAGTAQGTSATSPDGITWTSRPSPTANGLTSFAYGAGVYAVGTSGNSMLVSTDALSWLPHYVPAAPTVVSSLGTNLGTGTTGTANLPTTGVAQNDVMILAISSTGSLPAIPAGWTDVGSVGSSGSDYLRVVYKVMGATPDTTAAITGISTSSTAVATAYRNVNTTTPIDRAIASSSNTAAATGLIFTASGVPTVSQTLVLGIGASKSASTFTTNNLTNIASQAGTTQSVAMGSILVQVAATTTPTLSSSVSATNSTITVVLRPAGAVAVSGANANGINKIVYGNSLFVAAGGGGSSGSGIIRTSSDGYTWTAVNITAFGTTSGSSALGLAYNGTTWVAVGKTSTGNPVVAYTTNPAGTWTGTSVPGSLASQFNDVLWDGTYFVATTATAVSTAVSNGTGSYCSTDGITWVKSNGVGGNTSSNGQKLSVANDRVFLTYANGPVSTSYYGVFVAGAITTTPAVWRQGIGNNFSMNNNKFIGVVYGNSTYVTWTTGLTYAYTSTDGLFWTSNGASTAFGSVLFDGTNFVGYNYAGTTVRTSTDGTSWTSSSTTGPASGVVASIYAGGKYVIASATGQILTATSALGTYTARTTAVGSDVIEDITYDGSKYIAVGTNYSSISTDGITWTSFSPSPFGYSTSANGVDIKYGRGVFLASNTAGTVVTSTDALTWTTVSTGLGAAATYLAIGSSLFAAATSSAIRVSTDLVTWTTNYSGTTDAITTLGAGGGYFTFGTTSAGAVLSLSAGFLTEGYVNQSYLTLSNYGQTILPL